MDEPPGGDRFGWKSPSQAQVELDDFLPAIRRPQTPVATATVGRGRATRTSVHLETGDTDPSETVLKIRPGSKEDTALLSDSSDSSSSVTSFKSADSVKSRPRLPRPEGDGGEQASPEAREPGAGRRDSDVESIMKKYLQK
jgi:myosin-18